MGTNNAAAEDRAFLERWKRQEELEEFWTEAERNAVRELGPPPQLRSPQDFGLTASQAQEIAAITTRLYDNQNALPFFWNIIPYPLEVWIAFQFIDFSIQSNWVTHQNAEGFKLLCFIPGFPVFLGANLFFLEYAQKCWRWGRSILWDRTRPGWRYYVEALKASVQNEKNYHVRKYDLTLAYAELLQKIALRKEDNWRKLSGIAFENELARLYTRMGYSVEKTPYTNDGGVDLRLKKEGRLTIVQCKAHQTRVSISTARELYASMMDFGADHAVIACFEGCTKPVEEYAKSRSISILSLKDVVALHAEYGAK